MNDKNLVHAVHESALPRRDFLRKSLWLASPLMLGGVTLQAFAQTRTSAMRTSPLSTQTVSSTRYKLPVRQRGSARLDVRNYGAVGNGVTDDTGAFQAAVNALPSSGGTVYVPSGTYLIDAVRSVRLRSYMHLQIASDAKLVAKPNGAQESFVVLAYKVRDVEISGGQIVGERDDHSGTIGEWGHGIYIRGSSHVTIRDVLISKCWGDGICVGGALVWQAPSIPSEDVFIANVVCTGNRRVGMTLGCVRDVKVYDSEFSNTNGTKPQIGIDIEPDVPAPAYPSIAYNILIDNCHIYGNAVYGMQIFKRAQSVTVKNCLIERNGSCGLVTVGCMATYIASNTIRNNSATGIVINDGTSNCQVSQNTSYGNYNRLGSIDRTDFTLYGWSSKIERDMLVRSAVSDIRITTNYYR